MGKTLDYVQEEATGRLVFRRVYPTALRPFLAEPKSVLKVPLGAKRIMTAQAFRAYEAAKRQFEADVKLAKSRAELARKAASSTFDRLSPSQIEDLASILIHDQRTGMEQRLQEGHGRLAGEGWAWLLPQLRSARLSGDGALLEDILGPTADALLASEGLRLDPADADGRGRIVWALTAKLISAGDDIQQHLAGFAPPIPERPARPANPRGKARTVVSLIDAYRAAKWEGWSRSSRVAVEPVFRLLRDTLGNRLVNEVTREEARGVMALVRELPSGLGKKKELAGLSVPEAVERGKALGLQPIGPGTANRGYLVHLSAVFNFARQEQWAPSNPFEGLSIHDPVAARDKRDPFTLDQLCTLFSVAPWDAPAPHSLRRLGAYWVPLVALFTGARLGEIAGLRIADVEELEGIPALRIRPYESHSIKNNGSRRDIPIHSALLQLGFLAFVAYRRGEAEPAGLLFPDGKANARGQWGAKLGERFVKHLRTLGIVGSKLGMHSFRHSFEDRLKAVGLHGTAEGKALAGRQVTGSEASYGSSFALADLRRAIERVSYPGVELGHLEPEGVSSCIAER